MIKTNSLNCSTSRSLRLGFTLMEVLLVLGILGVIMAMVVPKVLGRQKYASIDATRVSLGGLSQALNCIRSTTPAIFHRQRKASQFC